MRITVIACLIAAALLSGWSASSVHSVVVGRADRELLLVALAASTLATISAAFALSVSLLRRRDWPAAYPICSLLVASCAVLIGAWAWLAA